MTPENPQTHLAANVLLVDDEPANLLALEAVLQELGANLVRAGSGREALKQTQDLDFAAILMDVRMPEMDGLEAAQLIRSRPRSRATPIIFVTADASELSIETAYAMGAVDFLTKPLAPAVLKAKVAFFIELQQSKEELRAAERAAVNDRAFLAAVLEAIEDGIVACDAHGVLTLFNRATRELHGLPEEPLPPDQWSSHYDLYRHDGRTPLPTHEIPLFRALSGELLHEAAMVVARKGEAPRTLLASGRPLYDVDGRKLGAVVSMHDVTAEREGEAAREASIREQARREEAEAAAERLRASEERARLATDAAELGIWQWDPVADVVTWENERPYQMFGLSVPDQPLSAAQFVAQFIHPDDIEVFTRAVARTVQTGDRFYFEGQFFRRSDMQLRWTEFTGVLQPQSEGIAPRLLGTAADITDRKRAEEKLRKSEERYRALFESMDEGFCIIELLFEGTGQPTDYRFLETNPAFEKHTGLIDARGRQVRELVPDLDSHWLQTYGHVAASGESVRFINEISSINRWFDVYASRVGGPGSTKVAVLLRNVTDRRLADESLRQLAHELAESDRRKTEFLATLAHELRNPLAPLRNGLHIMELAADNPQAMEKARQIMARQVNHMVHLVNDLLDVARITSGKVELKKERLELRSVVTAAVETSMPLIEASQHHLTVRLPEHPILLDADPTRLAQVLSNLLNNAAKYTPPGGRIALEASHENDQVMVSISDSGIGIPPAELASVFDMFTQVGRNMDRAQGGLGIGLSLVRRLTELHGGTVTATSPGAGLGSVFSVRLRLADRLLDPASGSVPSESSNGAGNGVRALVVDDNPDVAESLSMLLQMGGHTTRVANSGDHALEVAPQFQPEIVFLDIGMPGKNGYDVARALRKLPGMERVVLVALTGWGAEADRALSKEAGFDHHLTKPAGMEEVEGVLSGLTRSSIGAV